MSQKVPHDKHNLYPQFQLFVCVSMHAPKVIADCDDVSTEYLLKYKNYGRL